MSCPPLFSVSRLPRPEYSAQEAAAKIALPLFACVLSLSASISSASIFKCVDNEKVTYSASPCGENAKVLAVKNEQAQPQQHGTLTLYLNANRSYTVPGTVNSHPVVFIVDTGASNTVISQRVADASGIRNCVNEGYANTANGVVHTCKAFAPNISFGSFHFNNLLVTVLPNLNVDALLGNDVLRNMKIQQQSGAMYISD